MDLKRVSDLVPRATGDRRLHDLIEENQAFGIIAMLMGLSQLLLGLHLLNPGRLLRATSWAGFILGAGGWLLIGIGINVFQGREAFDGGGIDSEWVWLWTGGLCILTIGVTVATVWVVLS